MNEENVLILLPYAGVGDVRFGMSPEEVSAIVGVPDSHSTNALKQRVEFRAYLNVAFSPGTSPRVKHFGIGRQIRRTTIADIELFVGRPETILQQLCRLDGDSVTYLGYVIFFDLGLTLTGFHDGDVDQRAVAMFERGAWDARRAKTAPLHIERNIRFA